MYTNELKKISISGAKNSATRLMAASLICDEKTTLYNFPTSLVDAYYKKLFIENVGGNIRLDDEKEIAEIESKNLNNKVLDHYNYPIRTTYLLVPGLLKKTGEAKVPYPGGCKIGNRGFDLHLMVWKKMGATVEEKSNYIKVTAKQLHAAEIDFPITTIGGTETALICGSVAKGTTVIRNAYISPEVFDLIRFLRSIGVDIEVVGNSFIKVHGTTYHRGTSHRIISDRIEAITWMIFSAIAEKPMLIENVPFKDMEIPLTHLQEAGVDFFANQNSVMISQECMPNGIQPFELATGTHPGVISDMQPFYVLLGLKANGISRIYDYRYPERITYLKELAKHTDGGLKWKKGEIQTTGKVIFKPAHVNSTDLRGSMAVLMAALLSEKKGESVIDNIQMAFRGYNKLDEKLHGLGYSFKINNGSMIV
ncbi:UDP-N-acetylglucosamine 1-carboxyvinyltransferase [Balneolales bacterium ANBcel1]|nr:UDP-N-acetylglucosamine 1-carboxyvinyltransferase [Balneolales bacterium ANBcel1]